MRQMKAIVALALASQLLLACSSATNSNAGSNSNAKTTTTTTNSTTTTNTASANTPATANNSNSTAPAQQSASTASGDNVYKHQEGGIQFELPAGWKAEPNGEQMTISTADNALSVVLWVPAEGSFSEAAEALDKELSKTITNVKENGEPKETTVGGMKTISQNGTGEVNGSEIQWAVDLIQAKKPVIVLTFAAPGIWEKHQGEYQQFAKSIKPLA